MAPATANRSGVSAWQAVARFGFFTALISVLLSLAVLPWSDLPWLKIIRRCVSLAAAASLWLCIRKFERRTFREYGFFDGRAGWRQLRFGLLLGLTMLLVMTALGLATGSCEIAITADRARLWRTTLTFIPAAALVSVLEELVFRGFILQHLLDSSRAAAVLVSSALYSIVHLKAPTFTLSTSLELGGLFLLGVVLSLSYLSTRQLYLAVGLHAVLAYGARVNKLLVALDPAHIWLVGTSRLVNGLASWAALIVLGGIVVWWARSSHAGGMRHGDV